MPSWMRRRRAAIAGAAALVACGAGFFLIGGFNGLLALSYGHNPLRLVFPTDERLEETRERANTILAEIESFKTRTGAYPASLADIVPSDLAALQQPTVGMYRWEYQLDAKKRFVLKFFVGPMYQKEWYEGAAGHWFVDY